MKLKNIYKTLWTLSSTPLMFAFVACAPKQAEKVSSQTSFSDKNVAYAFNNFLYETRKILAVEITKFFKNTQNKDKIENWKQSQSEIIELLESLKDDKKFDENSTKIIKSFSDQLTVKDLKDVAKFSLLNDFGRKWIVDILSPVSQLIKIPEDTRNKIGKIIDSFVNFATVFRSNLQVDYINSKISLLKQESEVLILQNNIKSFKNELSVYYEKEKFSSFLQDSELIKKFNNESLEIIKTFDEKLAKSYFSENLPSASTKFSLINTNLFDKKLQIQENQTLNVAFNNVESLKEILKEETQIKILDKFYDSYKNLLFTSIENNLIASDFVSVTLVNNNSESEAKVVLYNKNKSTKSFDLVEDDAPINSDEDQASTENMSTIKKLSSLVPSDVNHIIKLTLPINKDVQNKIGFEVVNNDISKELNSINLGLYQFNRLLVKSVLVENNTIKVDLSPSYDLESNKVIDDNSFDVIYNQKYAFITALPQIQLANEIDFDIYFALSDEEYQNLFGKRLNSLNYPTLNVNNASSQEDKDAAQKQHDDFEKAKETLMKEIRLEIK
ncbi:hypothetical protein [Mycoplasmopsis edwardii]|nr:hypothetical protein [Mycoplasmopsis edwardii]